MKNPAALANKPAPSPGEAKAAGKPPSPAAWEIFSVVSAFVTFVTGKELNYDKSLPSSEHVDQFGLGVSDTCKDLQIAHSVQTILR